MEIISLINPICITICIENGRYSSYVLQWNTTQKQPMKILLHIFTTLLKQNCNTQMIG